MDVNGLIDDLKLQGITSKPVLDAIKHNLRENFILKEYKDIAYEDRAMPILANQTISQPYTVAFMLQELELKEKNKVLEIGAGSGWNSALISCITKNKVYAIEYNKEVAEFAEINLRKNKVKGVKVIIGDGNKGYKKEAPFDRIIVTAACSKIPSDLLSQLKNNGILLVPVGSLLSQNLLKIRKKGKDCKKENLGQFVFVPLKGKYGFN
ncbi:protein-L-isoaspartate(D-aspartate) O-methyltransferase [Candidatus Woesearchaeota archaeon]|nr:protein-L-isoaspartate(D-aspartate) O-methyltransferase [Candidatus Woesearchaeota archaeon]